MQDTDAPWSPTPGEYVLVKATGEGGEVADIIGEGDGRHFVVAISPDPSTSTSAPERRDYRLDELGPAQMA